ncbi:unnamed protein product, partial [marine sediment metagenome]
GKATDLIYDGEFEDISSEYIKREKEKIVHGAGCSFSAALAAELAKGNNLRDAAVSAKKFVHDAISGGEEVSNLIVVNQVQGLRKDADRYFVLENVKEAVRMLKNTPNFKNIIPEVGTNIGMAIECAESEFDVAAVDGRINPTKLKGNPIPTRISKILLPTALETAKLPMPFSEACTDTKRSGIEVAIAIIIKLKSDSDKPKVLVT